MAAIAVDTLMFSAIVPALPEFQREMGLSDTGVALIFAAFPVAQLLVAPFAAKWVDRLGRRPAIIAGAVLLALAGVGFAVASDPWSLAVARAVLGGASAITWTGALAYVSDVYPPDQLGFRLGLAETAGGGAGLMAPLLSGLLIEWIGITETFLLLVAFPVALIVWALAVPETRTHRGPTPGMFHALKGLSTSPGARAGAIALILLAIVEGMSESLLPLDLAERLMLSTAAVGLVVSLSMATLFLGAPLGGRWSDIAGRRTPILAGGILAIIALPLMAVGPAWWVTIAAALTLLGTSIMAAPAGPLFTAAVDDMGLAGSYGISAGAIVMVFAIGFVLGPLIGGVLSAVMPFLGVCIAVAVIVAAGLVLIARVLPASD
jgi:DHA1 family multidrug resistance protein-like MFS transporter